MIRLGGEPELRPHAAHDALHDAEAHRVPFPHADGRVPELSELAQVLVVPTIGDVFTVEVERSAPRAVDRAGPVALAGRAQE